MSAWVQLVIAGLLETCWAVGLKYTDGFRRPLPTLFVVATLAGSMFLLGSAARTLPIGTAYAVWVGIGAYRLSPTQIADNVQTARRAGATGLILFSYDSLINSRQSASDYLSLVGRMAFTPSAPAPAGSR